MNRLANNFDPKFQREPLVPFINERFINFNHWLNPIAKGNRLEQACGFNSMTVYIQHASRHALPVTIAGKTAVILKNDHEDSIHDISLSTLDLDKEVFSLKTLSLNESIRLEFVCKGRYRLHFAFQEAGERKEADFELIVR